MSINAICKGNLEQERLVKKTLVVHVPWMKEIYHYLQSKSKVFPWIDYYTFREEFLKKLKLANPRDLGALEQLVMKNTIVESKERG